MTRAQLATLTHARQSERLDRVSGFATTPHEHPQILTKAPDTVVGAIEDVVRKSS